MTVPHRLLRLGFALLAGGFVAFYAWERAGDPELRVQRQREEAAVLAARGILESLVAPGIEIVDPLAPRRAVGKAYVWPAAAGWDVSGHYRRGRGDPWHPFLLRLDAGLALVELSVRDPGLASRAADDERVVVLP